MLKGKRVIRKRRYPLQPMDLVYLDGKFYFVIGTNNKGKTVVLGEYKKVPSVAKVKLVKSGKGFCYVF